MNRIVSKAVSYGIPLEGTVIQLEVEVSLTYNCSNLTINTDKIKKLIRSGMNSHLKTSILENKAVLIAKKIFRAYKNVHSVDVAIHTFDLALQRDLERVRFVYINPNLI